jgi:hypothetical protein
MEQSESVRGCSMTGLIIPSFNVHYRPNKGGADAR